jgi:hypothetical protein
VQTTPWPAFRCSQALSQLRRKGVLELLPPSHARVDSQRLAAAAQAQDAV